LLEIKTLKNRAYSRGSNNHGSESYSGPYIPTYILFLSDISEVNGKYISDFFKLAITIAAISFQMEKYI
jgi:hypothetical protein